MAAGYSCFFLTAARLSTSAREEVPSGARDGGGIATGGFEHLLPAQRLGAEHDLSVAQAAADSSSLLPFSAREEAPHGPHGAGDGGDIAAGGVERLLPAQCLGAEHDLSVA